ncbi:hypothetical protein C7S16_4474 [Burkholderia thailandensis]|uniref:Uncharacterized protein n=1 Tax=Burkholderia thailandensis TaxID=57975 RepID=A0AAW9CU46_BURTH|nr:hypothetical protein [Burkholderia thailandensis]
MLAGIEHIVVALDEPRERALEVRQVIERGGDDGSGGTGFGGQDRVAPPRLRGQTTMAGQMIRR